MATTRVRRRVLDWNYAWNPFTVPAHATKLLGYPTTRCPRPMTSDPGRESDSDPPGVPGLHSWRSVYVFVFLAFLLVVIALTIFARVYA